jgi:hypothetical protein
MSRSIETAIAAARARAVPWDAERSARIEHSIGASRARWVPLARWARAAPLARWALGGLASVALYASVLHVSRVGRERGAPEQRFDEPAPPSAAPSAVPPEEEALAERPVGDGGFE